MATTNINRTQGNAIEPTFSAGTVASGWDAIRNRTTSDLSAAAESSHRAVSSMRYLLFGATPTYNAKLVLLDFDLSSVNTTITGLKLKLYGKTSTPLGGSYVNNDVDAIILEGTFDSSLDGNDVNNFTGFTSGWDASDVTEYSSQFGPVTGGWSTSGYNEITLNSDAISAAETNRQAGNRFKCFIMDKQVYYDNDASVLDNDFEAFAMNFYFKDGDDTYTPILEVTHADAAATPITKTTINSGHFKVNSGTVVIK